MELSNYGLVWVNNELEDLKSITAFIIGLQNWFWLRFISLSIWGLVEIMIGTLSELFDKYLYVKVSKVTRRWRASEYRSGTLYLVAVLSN